MLCGIFDILGFEKGTLQVIYLFSTYNKKGAPQNSFHFLLYYSKESDL